MECLLEQGLRLERTKVGAGEKEHAYVLKKHQYLQISACLFVCFVFLGGIGFFYRYELLEMAQQQRELFKYEKATRKNEQGVEDRLMRVTTALQAHLRRDKHERDMMKIYFSRLKESNSKHMTSVQGLLDKNLEKAKFQEELLKVVKDHDDHVYGLTKRYTKAIYDEGTTAEARLERLNQEMLGELRAEVEEERLDKKEMDKFANLDEGSDHNSNRQTASQKLLTRMLKKFQSRVEAVELLELTPAQMKEWQHLLRDVKSGKMEYEKGEEKMMSLMETASVGPLGAAFENHDSILESFEVMLTNAKFSPSKKAVLELLAKVDDGKIQLPDAMLDIEKRIEAGTLDPSWLLEYDTPEEKAANTANKKSAKTPRHHTDEAHWPGT